jgi:glycosyltransferase involved in cell wall biosynthesis
MPDTKRLLCVTNIPTPYRTHLFNALHQELSARGASLEVLFMSSSETGRHWASVPAGATFPHRIAWGVHPRLGRVVFHVNPGIVASVLRTPPTWLLVGGSWNMPTSAATVLGTAILKRDVPVIFWAEANLASMGHPTGPVAALRSMVMRRSDAFAVPGRIAEDSLRQLGIVGSRPLLLLPNVVDEQAYGEGVDRLRRDRPELRQKWNLADDDLVLFWPARLHEKTKGLMNFLDAVKLEMSPRVKILIAGEGPDRYAIDSFLARTEFQGVRLLGWRTDADVQELLAVADALLLPSLADPNPLAVVEGLWAGLPLLISDRCGNWPEAVGPDNGWVIDPGSPESMRAAFKDLVAKPAADLASLGLASRSTARERFGTRTCVAAFVDALERLDMASVRTG